PALLGRGHACRRHEPERALPARDAARRRAFAPEHRPPVRLGRDRGRPALRGLRVRPRRDAEGGPRPRGPPRLERDRAPHDAGARRALLRARARGHPPRLEAREHHGDQDRRAAERARAGLGPGRSGARRPRLDAPAPHGDVRAHGDALLRGARAAPRRGVVAALGPLLVGTRLPRVPDGSPGDRRQLGAGDHSEAARSRPAPDPRVRARPPPAPAPADGHGQADRAARRVDRGALPRPRRDRAGAAGGDGGGAAPRGRAAPADGRQLWPHRHHPGRCAARPRGAGPAPARAARALGTARGRRRRSGGRRRWRLRAARVRLPAGARGRRAARGAHGAPDRERGRARDGAARGGARAPAGGPDRHPHGPRDRARAAARPPRRGARPGRRDAPGGDPAAGARAARRDPRQPGHAAAHPPRALGRARGLAPAETLPPLAAALSLPLDPRWPRPQLTPEREKELAFDALLRLLVRRAADRPVVVAFEDLHWADPTTLALLSLIVREVGNGDLAGAESPRILLVATARPEFMPPLPIGEVTPIPPTRLERDEVETMVNAGLASGRPLPRAVIEEVI